MYKIVLIIIGMLVVYGIFAFQNPFNNSKITALRGIVAVLVGWILVILTSLLVNNMDMSAVHTATELATLEEKNSARMMGALFFGWAYPLIFIELVWGGVYLFRYWRDRNNIRSDKMLKS